MAVVLVLGACGEVEEIPDASSSPIDAAAVVDAATAVIDAAGGQPDAAATDPDARTGVSCTSSSMCAADSFCDFPANQCGEGSVGACVPVSTACPGDGTLTCGCDNNLYSDACAAAGSGVDRSERGSCDTPDGFVRCGPSFCLASFDYCEVTDAAIPGAPTEFRCVPIPAACADAPSCDCLVEAGACGDACERIDTGGFVVTCPPPP